MTASHSKRSRRAFFLQSGAALGAGVAASGSAAAFVAASATPSSDESAQLQMRLALLEDREAIRRLQLQFTKLIEDRQYELAAELFTETAQLQLSGVNAQGRSAIHRAFAVQYRDQQADVLHNAYRHSAAQQEDSLAVSDGGQRAAATFYVEAQLCAPLRGDCTVVQMARLQGCMADRRWEAGRFDVECVRIQGQWKIASLSYKSA